MRRIGMATTCIVALTACDDTFFGPEPEELTTLTEGYCGVQEVFQVDCAPCHLAESATFDLDLETDAHGATVDVVGGWGQPLVTPGDRENSLLYTKMAGTNPDATGGIMPTSGLLDEAKIELIGAWIDDGADGDCAEGDADTDADADSDSDSDTDSDTDTDVTGSWCAVEATLADHCVDCHDASADDGYAYIDLETDPHTTLVQASSQVVPGAVLVVPWYPEASLAYRKVAHAQGETEGDPMPAEGIPQMDAAKVEAWETWIAAGAPLEDCDG